MVILLSSGSKFPLRGFRWSAQWEKSESYSRTSTAVPCLSEGGSIESAQISNSNSCFFSLNWILSVLDIQISRANKNVPKRTMRGAATPRAASAASAAAAAAAQLHRGASITSQELQAFIDRGVAGSIASLPPNLNTDCLRAAASALAARVVEG